MQRKPSWFKRLFRRRSTKNDRSAPYEVRKEEEDKALVRVVRSGSDPELSASRSREKSPEQRGGNAEGNEGEAKPQRRKLKVDKPSRNGKSLSTAFEHMDPVPTTGMAYSMQMM